MSRSNYRNYYKDKDIENDKIVEDAKEEVKEENIEDVKDEKVKEENIEDVKDEKVKEENIEDVKDEKVKEENIEDVKDEKVKEEKVTKGIVVNCSKLNVRRTANKLAKVLTVIDAGTEVIIDGINITNGFYKVIVNDIEGYCVKDYIEIK